MPWTLRSGLTQILGKASNGSIGHVVDVLGVVATILGCVIAPSLVCFAWMTILGALPFTIVRVLMVIALIKAMWNDSCREKAGSSAFYIRAAPTERAVKTRM